LPAKPTPRDRSCYPRLTLAPPSTGKVTPVIKLASSEARNSAACDEAAERNEAFDRVDL
jgi:hypothetical protein